MPQYTRPAWKWWVWFLIGAVAIGFAMYEYHDMRAWELEGGTRRMNSISRLLYRMFGIWGVVLTTAGVGIIFVAVGVVEFRRTRRPRG